MSGGGTLLHATCVAIGGRGVLLTGRSGSGKSDLALRLIDRGARLVSDDGTVVEARAFRLFACAPATIVGKIEVRGLGIVELPSVDQAVLCLSVALDRAPARMPDDPLPTDDIAGVRLPTLNAAPFEASAPVKVEQALLMYGLPL